MFPPLPADTHAQAPRLWSCVLVLCLACGSQGQARTSDAGRTGSDAGFDAADSRALIDAAVHDGHRTADARNGPDAVVHEASRGDTGAPEAGVASLAGLWFFDSAVGYAGPAAYPNNPSLTGGCVQIYWNQLETSPGQYSWAAFDQKVAAWVNAGKPFCLRFNGYTAASGYGGSPGTTPMWLLDAHGPLYNLSSVDALPGAAGLGPGGALVTAPLAPAYVAGADWPAAGARYFVDIDGTILPVWWDKPYLTAYRQFVQAVHDHLAGKSDPRWLPSWVQLGTGHAGETYLSKNSVPNPVTQVAAAQSSTASTLAANTYFAEVLPVYGSGNAGAPPQVADGYTPLEASVAIAAGKSIQVTWSPPAVITPAPLEVTGYLVWWGTASGQEKYSAYVGASSSSFTITTNVTSSVVIEAYNAEGSGLPHAMWNLAGAAGDAALMGNSRFSANTDLTQFLPEVAAAIASDQGAIFADVPCVELVVNNPGGSMYTNVTNAVLGARANTFIQSDGLTQTAPAPNATELMQSQAHGFAVYEEKAPISMASYLPEEAANALAATVHVLLVFETECNQFSPSSPTYSPAWATAAASAASTLRP